MRRWLGPAATLLMLIGMMTANAEESRLRVGTEAAYPPFNYKDSAGNLQGFDIDIANALCEQMNVHCEFVVQDWEGLIPALLTKKIDAIISSMSITKERQKVVDFTDRYYKTPARFVAQTASKITDVSPIGLAGRILGAQASTIHGLYLQNNYTKSNIRLYGSQDTLLLDLATGRIDVAFLQSTSVYDWLTSTDGKCCQFVGDPMDDPTAFGLGAGIAIRKNSEILRRNLNNAIENIIENGTYKRINSKYFPFSIY